MDEKTASDLKEIKDYLAMAYCIDGDIKDCIIKIGDVSTILFEMTDSKRGRFGTILLTAEKIDALKSNVAGEPRH